jgi:hypothetical protein
MVLFIGNRFRNLYTAVDTPAEAACCHSGWRVRPNDLAAPRDGPPKGLEQPVVVGGVRRYRGWGFRHPTLILGLRSISSPPGVRSSNPALVINTHPRVPHVRPRCAEGFRSGLSLVSARSVVVAFLVAHLRSGPRGRGAGTSQRAPLVACATGT